MVQCLINENLFRLIRVYLKARFLDFDIGFLNLFCALNFRFCASVLVYSLTEKNYEYGNLRS